MMDWGGGTTAIGGGSIIIDNGGREGTLVNGGRYWAFKNMAPDVYTF